MNDGKTFLYHAHGVAVGGVMRRPFDHVIESQAATSLAITGGYGSARSSNFKFQELIRFAEAYTQVAGSQNPKDGSYNTLVSTTIEGLNVDDMVTADRIVARLATIHGPDDAETRVVPSGCEFVNLRIGGHHVDAELDLNLFCELDTSHKFKELYQRDAAFHKEMRARFLWGTLDKTAPDFLRERYKWQKDEAALPESKGILPCSLVKSVRVNAPELKVYGNVIIVPQFGVIYLAEYQVKESSRRLTMMRMMLGSPQDGDVTIGGVEGNGTSYP